jgi:hypothetical protein
MYYLHFRWWLRSWWQRRCVRQDMHIVGVPSQERRKPQLALPHTMQ